VVYYLPHLGHVFGVCVCVCVCGKLQDPKNHAVTSNCRYHDARRLNVKLKLIITFSVYLNFVILYMHNNHMRVYCTHTHDTRCFKGESVIGKNKPGAVLTARRCALCLFLCLCLVTSRSSIETDE